MNEPRWDDERLTAAFRDAFGRRPPANLAAAAACAVRAAPQRREAAPWRRIATAAAVVVLAVASIGVGAGLIGQRAGTAIVEFRAGPRVDLRTLDAHEFSLDFPAAWLAYAAGAVGSGGSSIAVLGSQPVESRCGDERHVDINCVYEQPLEPGAIRVFVGTGAYRDGSTVVSRPSRDNARTTRLTVDGMPALLDDYGKLPNDYYRADVTLDWSIGRPATLTNFVSIAVRAREGSAMTVAGARAAGDAIVASLRFTRTGPDASAPNALPADAVGLPVRPVTDAIATRDAGPDDRELAVAGWFTPATPMSCPAPLERPTSPVQPVCPDQFVWLMEDAEALIHVRQNQISGGPPTGPAIQVDFDDVDQSWFPPLPTAGDSVPAHVVFVGHFDDRRSALCPRDEEQACRDRFVVDRVDWVDGRRQPVSEIIQFNGTPRSLVADVVDHVTHVAAPGATALHALVTDGELGLRQVEPSLGTGAGGLIDRQAVWIVRVLEGQRLATRRVATYLVADGTTETWRLDARGLPVAIPDSLPTPTPMPTPSATGPAGFPTEVHGLPVMTVSDALARIATPDFDDRAIAIAGWYIASSGPIACPMIRAGIPPIERRCPDGFEWLMQDPERPYSRNGDVIEWRRPSGPALNPLVRAGVAFDVPAAPNDSEPDPVAVVLIGHFGDIRAANFEQRNELVVDALVWRAGEAAGDTVAGDPDLATEPRDGVEARITTALGRAGATWAAVIAGDWLAMIEPDLARRAPELTAAKALWVVHRLTVQDGVPVVGVAYTPDRGARVWGANRFEPDLQPTIRIDLDERPDHDVPLAIVDGPDAVLAAEPVPADAPDLPVTIRSEGHEEIGSVSVANLPGRPDRLRIDWEGTACDIGWGMTVFADVRSIYLWPTTRPACDSVPASRGVILTFDRTVRAQDVVILDPASVSGG